MKKLYFFTFACLVSILFSIVNSQVYVNSGDNLQDAVNLAESGTTIYVAEGTYNGNFTMKEGVNVSGSWNADFTVRDTALHASVLDAENSGRVLTQGEEYEMTTTWSGFVIQNGLLADAGGAGVYLHKNGVLDSCIVQNCVVTTNHSGGGVNCNHVSGIIRNCILRNNITPSTGGGIWTRGLIENSLLTENKATGNAGGGAQLQAGKMVNCIVVNNHSDNNAGGLRLYGACTVINSLIANNTSTGVSGGILCNSTAPTIVGCTVVGNKSASGAGGIHAGSMNEGGILANNIIWGNSVAGESAIGQIHSVSKFSTRANNAVYNQNTGVGSVVLSNINDADDGPRFTNPENRDYTLMDNSICIDAGLNDYVATYNIVADLNGNNRIVNETVDVGAYENQKSVVTNLKQLADGNQFFFPNPATEYLYINGNISRATIFTLDGRQVLDENVCGVLSVKSLNKGTYLLKMTTDNHVVYNQVLIVE